MYVYAMYDVYMLCAGAEREKLRPWSKLLDTKHLAVWNVAATGLILVLEYGSRGRERTWGKEHFHTLKMGTTLGDRGLPCHRGEQGTQTSCFCRVCNSSHPNKNLRELYLTPRVMGQHGRVRQATSEEIEKVSGSMTSELSWGQVIPTWRGEYLPLLPRLRA